MPGQRPDVSDAELEILKVLWTHGPGTVRDVEAHLPRRGRVAYNTLLTLLVRLREKGYVGADRSGPAHVFHPRVSRDELVADGLQTLARRICDGTTSPLVHALVRQEHLSPDDVAALRRLLDSLEPRD